MSTAVNVASPAGPVPPSAVQRVVVYPVAGELDPVADAALEQARAAGIPAAQIRTARVYLIESPLTSADIQRIASELLADPVTQRSVLGEGEAASGVNILEVHFKPGVMDPVAQSTREAILEMFPGLGSLDRIDVRTGVRYELTLQPGASLTAEALKAFAERQLANTVVQDIHLAAFHPSHFEHGSPYHFRLRHVSLLNLDDAGLMKLSREGHLFLSLDEMHGVQEYFRQQEREPTDIELETIAQTWSEHCVHKTLKSKVEYRQSDASDASVNWSNRPGHTVNPDGSVTINNLLKSTIAAATKKLMQEPAFKDWCISVFVDNAGIVGFDDEDAVCIKVETHNHPSAIEPYGGSATGAGGCIRDIMGTGLSARPIANTDVFCVAPPEFSNLPKGVLHPRRVLQQVVAGVRDYGNRMGIPTVNGAVYFHPDYLANPLVYCGCVGIIPRDKCFGGARPGDHIIALGGRTGRDGIHGATFSSDELTDTHADEFAHAVQIGNAITQKRMLDVILQARDHASGCLYHGLTDCGAGGFSSAVGEMGKDTGARVHLDHAPLKYQGLSYTEIWISEAQERMVLAVPADRVQTLRELCQSEDLELCDLGTFGCTDASGQPQLVLHYHEHEVGRLSMHLLHEGIPQPTRKAAWSAGSFASRLSLASPPPASRNDAPVAQTLEALLNHPNIASKHWIIRQYDHEVQGGSAVKPLVGIMQNGPSDASVIRPKLKSNQGIALACGLQTGLGEKTPGGDSYWMALAAIDEAVRNCVCVGADPGRIAVLDNFCWAKCDDPAQLGSLVRAAEGCYDAALAYRTPFVSGKDSLSNQFTTEDGRLITIPPTLLITAMGIVPDVLRCVTMDAKAAGNLLLIVGQTGSEIGGSHLAMLAGTTGRDARIPHVNLQRGPIHAATVAKLIARGLVASAHDCSDGGLLVAAAEMAFAGGVGLDLDLATLPATQPLDVVTASFAETPSRYLLEVAPAKLGEVVKELQASGAAFGQIGRFAEHANLTLRTPTSGRVLDASLDSLRQIWLRPLDW